MSRPALVDHLYAERYGLPHPEARGGVVAALAQHAPPLPVHGLAAVCHHGACTALSTYAFEVPFRGTHRACNAHLAHELAVYVPANQTTDIRLTRIAP